VLQGVATIVCRTGRSLGTTEDLVGLWDDEGEGVNVRGRLLDDSDVDGGEARP
jgi:hypothetical protein